MMVITGLVVLVVGGGSYLASYRVTKENIENSLRGEARIAGQSLEALLNASIEGSGRLGKRSLVTNALMDSHGLEAYLLPFLREQRGNDPNLMALSLHNFLGEALAETRQGGVVWPDVAPLVDATLKDGKHRLLLVREVPVRLVSVHPVHYGPTGTVEGVVVAMTNLDKAARTAFLQLPPGVDGLILDGGDRVLTSRDQASLAGLVYATRKLTGSPQLDGLNLRLVIGLPESAAMAPLNRMTWGYLLFGLLAFAVAVNLAMRVARRMALPLAQLSRQARAVARGADVQPEQFAIHGHGEIDILSEAFQRMLESLRAAHEGQEEMIRSRTRELAETQRRLQGVVASLRDMIYSVNLDLTRCLYASPAAKAIFGVDDETLKSGRVFWLDAILAEDRETYLRAFRQANFEGAAEVVYRLPTRDGGIRWIYERFVMSFDEAGRPDHMDGVAHEITKRKEAELARAALEDSLRLKDRAVDASDNGTLLCDARLAGHPIVYANPAFEHLNGYPLDEVLGYSWLILRPDKRDTRLLAELRRHLRDGRSHRVTLRLRRKDDSLFWCDLSVSPVRDPEGKITHYLFIQTDVSERVESEERYRRLVESVQEAIFQTDLGGLLTFLSPAWTTITRHAVAECLGADLGRFVHPDDMPMLQVLARGLLAGQDEAFRLELRLYGADAQPRWIALHARQVLDQDECVVGMAGTLNDITEQRRIQDSLRLHDRAMAQSGNGIVISDMRQPGQPVIYVNPAFERITGYPAAEALGRNCNFLQAEDLRQEALDDLRMAVKEEREAQVVLRNYRKDGSLFWNELDISPVRDASGKVTHYIGVQNDITDRILAGHALEEQSRRLNTIFSLSPDGFASFDADGSLSYVNPAFLAMTGLSAEEMPGLSLEAFDDRLSRLAAPGQPYPRLCLSEAMDAPTIRQDGQEERRGSPRDTLVLSQPSPRVLQRSLRHSDSRQAAITLYFRDVTRETEVDRMKSEFLSTAAHELRTPLASIMGFSELLLMREYDDKRRRDMLETMHRQSRRLTNLLNELLDLARIEARQGKDFNLERLPLGQLLADVLKAFLVPDDPRVVETNLPAILPSVEVDKAKLQQAMLNVLSNAYKYSPQGGAIRLETLEGRHHGRPSVGIRITDQGMGMTPEQLNHLFERFWRADTTGHIPGTGLGMALVKEIIEHHGGVVDVASEYGQGTAITLWLPVTTDAAEENLALAA
jgi:PAS domain S-box-containing protein